MSSLLTCHVERTRPVALVRLSGVLDLGTAGSVRSTLLRCLDDQPAALVLDVAGLLVGDDLALALLPTLSERAELWPGAPVLLCAPTPELAEALRRMAVTMPSYPTREEAMAVAADAPTAPRMTEALDPDRLAPARARELVGQVCAEWHIDELAPTAQLVATELVSNGVMHARTPLVFTVLLRGGRLYVAVHDRDSTPARMQEPTAELDEHGRGLLVVDALASSWGTLPTPEGKVVWAAVANR